MSLFRMIIGANQILGRRHRSPAAGRQIRRRFSDGASAVPLLAAPTQRNMKGESMKKLIPRDKLSKKEKRALDQKQRRTWDQPPVTRVIPNKKKIEEAKKPRPGREDAGWGCFLRRGLSRKSKGPEPLSPGALAGNAFALLTKNRIFG